MSEPKTVVRMLRHGEVYNPMGILYGRLEGYGLSQLGTRMAEMVAESLAGEDITHVMSSPLQRAQETAAPLAEKLATSIVTDERLIEPTNHFEGKRVSVGDGALRDPRHWWMLRNPFTPSWGEPYLEVARRMTAALTTAREHAEGHQAVCVSHQLPIWVLRNFIAGKRLWHDPRRRQCELASLTSFHFEGGKLVDVKYTEPAGSLLSSSSAPRGKGA